MLVVTKDNMEKFCRFCLQVCESPVADQPKLQFELRLMRDISHPPNVRPARILSMRMCEECYARSQQLCAFREQALSTEEALRLLYEDDLQEEALYHLDRFCRLCLERLPEVTQLCTTAELHECIIKCTNIRLDETDANRSFTPKYLCPLCHKMLQDLVRFSDLVKQSLHQLQDIFKQIEVKDVGTQVTADMIQTVNDVNQQPKPNLPTTTKSNPPSPARKKKPKKVTFKVNMIDHIPIKAVKTEVRLIGQPKQEDERKPSKPKQSSRVKCLKCKKSFREHMLLDAHVSRDHEGISNPFKCTQCPKSYRFINGMRRHMESEHAVALKKSYPCAICGQNFSRKENARNHLRVVHMGERPHKCCYCDRSFSTPYALRRHEMKHTGARPCQCNLCSRTFRDNWDLMIHMQGHVTDSALLCSICHRAQESAEALRAHMAQKHEHKCSKCGKIFARSSDLRIHVNAIHLKQRNWKCRCCQKSFAFKHSRERHERKNLKNRMDVI